MTSNDPAMAKALALLSAQLLLAWNAETAANGQWDSSNPALNQAQATALVVHTCLGGDVIQGIALTPTGERIAHFWNRIADADRTIVDLTARQFPNGTLFKEQSVSGSDFVDVADRLLADEDTAARYTRLLGRLSVATLAA